MTSSQASTHGAPITLYHRRHARQQRRKSMGHLGPALVLLMGVAPVLSGKEPLTALMVLEMAVGLAYLLLMVRELRHLRRQPFHRERVAWLELAAAAILAIESYHIWHRHHEAEAAGAPPRFHVLPWLYAAVACIYVVLAFRMKDLAGRRFLHLHDGGFAVRTKPFGRAQALSWANVTAVEPAGTTDLLVHRPNGQLHRISFADLHDGPAHRDQLLAHCQLAMSN